jgi:predicted TIM-barrel fold metal-dependent hydrolase
VTTITDAGSIDCDVHITVPEMRVLLPYLDDYWRDHLTARGTDKLKLVLTSYPPNAPLVCRDDWRAEGPLDLAALRRSALDGFGSRFAIVHTIHTSQVFYSEDMAAALCRALNSWIAAEWLDAEPRLRAAIVVPWQNPQLAAEEIAHWAHDRRFVAVQILLFGEAPLGRRVHWPLYEAAEKHDLPLVIHAGSSYRYAPTPTGWPSYALEDYVAMSYGFQSQLLSLLTEGVFVKFPKLKVVLAEAGISWLPGFMWRVDKTWRGLRRETPWLTEPPSKTIRERVRFTLQPFNAPPDPLALQKIIEHIDCDDLLLFSTDYPHWHFDGTAAIPNGFPERLLQKLLVDNPLATYSRLRQTAQAQQQEVVS